MTIATQEKALAEYRQLFEPVTWYRSLHYKTLNTWSRFRRVVAKVAYGPSWIQSALRRHLFTNAAGFSQSALHPTVLSPRGDGESLSLNSNSNSERDRTSTHTNECNQLRLWFSTLAYVLMHGLRESCLATTELTDAQVGTIRTKLLKLGARLLISVRRIQIAISTGCPFQAIFSTAYRKLQTLPNTG